MKKITFVLIIFTFFWNNIYSQNKNYLLLRCDIKETYSYIAIDSINNEIQNPCIEPFICNYHSDTSFFPNIQTFFVDKQFSPTDSTSIIIWRGQDFISEVFSLPSKDSFFSIEQILDDSSLVINIKEKQAIIKPFQIFSDSIFSIKNVNQCIIKYKTSITITNLGSILKRNIIDITQLKKEHIYEYVQSMNRIDLLSRFPNGEKGIKKFLNQNLYIPSDSIPNGIKGRTSVEVTVNSSGQVENTKILESINSYINKELIRVIYKMKWQPDKMINSHRSISLPISYDYK